MTTNKHIMFIYIKKKSIMKENTKRDYYFIHLLILSGCVVVP